MERAARSVLLLIAVCGGWPIVGLAQSTHTASAEAAPAAADPIELQPGDAVRITVWRQPELSGQFVVTVDGSISHPLFRGVHVTGLPLPVVEARLDSVLLHYTDNPQFVIEPLLRVAVSGEVRQPNLLAVSPGTTVAQAVAQAGGITEDGRRNRVRLVRAQAERVLDLTNPRDGQLPVRSGDELVVDRRSQWFRNVLLPAATILGAAASLIIVIRRHY